VDEVDPAIRPARFADLVSVLAEHEIPWAVWDYGRGGFGMPGADATPGRIAGILTGSGATGRRKKLRRPDFPVRTPILEERIQPTPSSGV
jgi:hypothetical protein